MTVTVLVGDAREVLPTLDRGDVVITDPVWPNCPPGLLEGADRPADLLRETLEVLPPSVKRLVIVLRSDSDPRFLRAVPDTWPFFHAAWLYYALPSFRGRKLGGNEVAYCFGEPTPPRPGRFLVPAMCEVAAQPVSKKLGHPSPRAMEHMVWLVDHWSDPGETIIDPFAGSGTTGLAADHRQRDAVLIEISPEYADMARRRVAEDAPLFASPENVYT